MLGLDPETVTSALRLWVAAGSAALIIVFSVLAFFWSHSGALRAGFVLLGAVLGAAMTLAFLDRAALGDRSAERRTLELRAEDLSAHALAPGSALACLDASAGDSVEAACERALFASPASVASASSYVAARLALLAGMAAYARRGGSDIDPVLLPLRRALEADRFGFVAHVLTVRDGCESQNCRALALLHDPSRVRANLSAGTLDHYLDRYQELWAKAPEGNLADAAPAPPTAPSAHKPVNIDFPSAASIPPVSIMNPEPTGPVLPGVAAAAAANPNGQPAATPSRRSRKPASNPPVQTVTQPAPSNSAATEPIWPEPVPPPPTPSQTATAPAGAPVQLNPSLPSANAGAAARAQ